MHWLVDWDVLMHSPRRIGPAAAAERERADTRAEAEIRQQGGPSPQSLNVTGDGVTPLTPVAGEAIAGGPAQPEDPEAGRLSKPSLFNPAIMTFGSRLACEWTCVSWTNHLC